MRIDCFLRLTLNHARRIFVFRDKQPLALEDLMGLLLTAAAASRIEKSGNDLADICSLLSSDLRYRGKGLDGDTRPGKLLPFKAEGLIKARRAIAENTAIRSIDILVRKADDCSVELLRVGKRGGWKRITRVWNKAENPI